MEGFFWKGRLLQVGGCNTDSSVSKGSQQGVEGLERMPESEDRSAQGGV